MNSKLNFCLRMLKVGCIGFGGGSALIPVLEDEFVKKGDEKESMLFEKDVIIASLTPGALPVEMASSIGRRSIGTLGMFLGSMMMALPGVLASLVCFILITSLSQQLVSYVKILSVAVRIFIIFLLFDYIYKTIRDNKKNRSSLYKTILIIFTIAFFVCGSNINKLFSWYKPVFSVSTVTVLLTAFFFFFYIRKGAKPIRLIIAFGLSAICLLGYGKSGVLKDTVILKLAVFSMIAIFSVELLLEIHDKNIFSLKVKKIFKDIFLWLLFLLILALPSLFLIDDAFLFIKNGILSSLLSFGGGDAYLTIAEGLFVDTGIIEALLFYSSIVTVVNIFPGSILCKTLTGIGFFVGLSSGDIVKGLLLALAGFGCSIAGSGLSFWTAYNLFDSITDSNNVLGIGKYIRPIISGLLINVILSLVNSSTLVSAYTIKSPVQIAIFVLSVAIIEFLIYKKAKVSKYWMLLIDVVLAFVFLL